VDEEVEFEREIEVEIEVKVEADVGNGIRVEQGGLIVKSEEGRQERAHKEIIESHKHR
jgi:hypothetical protein